MQQQDASLVMIVMFGPITHLIPRSYNWFVDLNEFVARK